MSATELGVFVGDAVRDAFPKQIALECPLCGCKLRPVPFMHHATLAVSRTCRGRQCGQRWSLLVKPGSERVITVRGTTGRMKFHTLEWTGTL